MSAVAKGYGRPSISFRKDEDRHAVALMGMMLRTMVNGKLPSERYASMLAAGAKEAQDAQIKLMGEPPKPNPAPTGHRNSPIPPWMKGGYRELSLSHERNTSGGVLGNCAQRLRRKLQDWSKPGSSEDIWLRHMGRAWAATFYPHAVSREIGCDPEEIGRSAAQVAGEHEFFEKILLPLLKQHLKSPENTARCKKVRFETF